MPTAVPIEPDEPSTCSSAGDTRSRKAIAPSAASIGSFLATFLISATARLDEMYSVMYISWMRRSYSIAAARAQLAELVDQAEAGKDVELTRRGKKVAVLLSAAKYARLSGSRVAFMSAFDNFCRDNDMREIGVEPGWAEELRDKSPGRSVKL